MVSERKPGTGRALFATLVSTVSISALVAFSSHAQEQGGSLATFGLSFGGQYEVNDPGENDASLTTGLGFDLRSQTRVQSFALSADAALVFDEAGLDLERPALSLDYTRENRSTVLSLGADYRIQDVDGTFDVIDPLTGNLVDIEDDDGTLETLGLEASLETGRDARFGTVTQLSFTDRSYSGTSDPDLVDLQSWQIGTTLRFDIDPRISLSADASYRETQEDDDLQTERRTTRVGVGGTFLIDPLWTASVRIGYSRFETEEDTPFGRVIDKEDGTGFDVSLVRQFRDGTLGFAVARNVSDIGAEDSLRILRERQLAGGGELAWSLGLVSFPSGDIAPIASASFGMPTRRGGFSAELQQTTTANNDDESVIRTAIDLGYDAQINANSSWSLSGSLVSADVIGGDDEDRTRAEVGIAYNHALTRDWGLSTSLRHQVTYEDGIEDERASILSLSLERSFSFRP